MNSTIRLMLTIIGTLGMVLISSHALALQSQKISCHKVSRAGAGIECVFRVSGEKSDDPSQFSALYATTKMPYALCSKALCTVDQKNKHLAKCGCPIYGVNKDAPLWQRISVGPKPHHLSAPTGQRSHLVTVTSNFSMANLTNRAEPHQVTCRGKKPLSWANCFGVRCKVSYQKEAGRSVPVANCQCPVVKTSAFISMGPADTRACQVSSAKIWSAATAAQGHNNNAIMTKITHEYGS